MVQKNANVKKIPANLSFSEEIFNELEDVAKQCVELSKLDWDFFETSWDFKKNPLI